MAYVEGKQELLMTVGLRRSAQNLRRGIGGTGGAFSAPRVRGPVPGVGLPRGRGRLSLRDSAGLVQKASIRAPVV